MIFHDVKVVFVLLALLAGLAFVPACAGKIVTNLPEPEYSSEATESLLLAINAGDYTTFSKDFDSAMQKALPANSFQKQFTEGIKGKIGDYQAGSKRFFQASSQAQFSTVVYYAEYSGDTGAVLVQISFKNVDGKYQVSGLFFNSPKLRG